MSPAEVLGVLAAALAGGLATVAIREAALAAPGTGRWLAEAVEPLRRAGREGHLPTELERRRLALLGTGAIFAAALLVLGPGPAPFLAAAGPAAATWAISRRRAAYRRAVERGLAEVAVAVADALAVGRSARAALAAAAASLEGPPAREMERVRAELALGAPTRDALEALRRRVDSPRVDSFAAALLSQQLAGGDLATLLRRFAAAAADRDRTEADARSATAQARFTGLLVVAMPVGAALLAELLDPGFVGGLLVERRLGDDARPRRRPAARRLRGDPAPEQGRRAMTAALAAAGVLLAFAAAWELAGGAGERLASGARALLGTLSARPRRLARRGRRAARAPAAARARRARRPLRAARRRRRQARRRRIRRDWSRSPPSRWSRPGSGSWSRRCSWSPASSPPTPCSSGPRAGAVRASSPRCPDALDMLAVGAASGRDPATGLGEIAEGTSGPLAAELAHAVAEVECGKPLRDAVAELRGRVPGAEVGALAAALERSRTYGSPLAEQLHLQATSLRREARRRIEDRAARSAPKIQLVVALVLVPSVLLTIVAAIIAHSDALAGAVLSSG